MNRRLLLLAPAAALFVALASVDLPLFALGPGPAREVLPLIDVHGARTYRPHGRMLLTTVGFEPATVFEAVVAWLLPDEQVVPEDQVIPPDVTEQEYERYTLADMKASQIAATVVALRRVTDYPERHGPGGLVQQVVPGSPADGWLSPGDVILAVDGRQLEDFGVLEEAVSAAGTRRDVALTVKRGNRERTVRLRPRRVPGADRPIVGIVVVENFPFDVTIRSGDVGGPSAGLMWALGLVDLLDPGDLLEGRTIAGTGAIDLEGRVQAIGGVGHKVVAAARAGAVLFLVPTDNLAEARAAGADIRLVAVSTVDEAIRELESS
ncbi:MAG TPA: S16 family serine protease [Actinomycetota bacterium]|jgi:PDZ domain-containing protein|nr:S16 family serine protease [Actinomycetota bacterium]